MDQLGHWTLLLPPAAVLALLLFSPKALPVAFLSQLTVERHFPNAPSAKALTLSPAIPSSINLFLGGLDLLDIHLLPLLCGAHHGTFVSRLAQLPQLPEQTLLVVKAWG